MRNMADASQTPAGDPAVIERHGLVETLDSVIVAFILAFVLRAFIVEAFVIPTGSMAPTLYGAHGSILCADCGTEFAYGLKDDPYRGDGHQSVSYGDYAICPNCEHENDRLAVNDVARNRQSGDRILVLKWPFDVGIEQLGPQRWDVTVFKDPSDGKTNYIKRLAGLPGEVLMIVDGDVYTCPVDELSQGARAEFEQLIRYKHEVASGQRGTYPSQMPGEVSQEVMAELERKLRISHKTEVAKQSLWRNVYDNDLPPMELDVRNQPHWFAVQREKSGWDTSRRLVAFENREVESDFIVLAGKEIDASCSYNLEGQREGGRQYRVSDLRVEFVFTPEHESAVVRVRLEKRGRVFWGTVRADGVVSVIESDVEPDDDEAGPLNARISPLAVGRPVAVAFENLDYRVSLRLAGQEVLATSDDSQSPAYYAPDVSELRSRPRANSVPPRIYGEGGSFALAHLRVARDIYYTQIQRMSDDRELGGHGGWGCDDNPIMLREHEYFMLGDNTTASKDSRLWFETGPHLVERGEAFQLGTVPEDQLVGRAFFVYWPSGHRIRWLDGIRPFDRLGIIPNVGRMRWIR